MIQPAEIISMIQASIPNAQVEVVDKTGMSDHFIIRVVSQAFDGLNLMDRHRLVMQALQPAYSDGRLHAAEIQTQLPA